MLIRRIAAATLLAVVAATTAARAQECDEQFESTFDLVQEVIFEAKGCTSPTCHSGAAPAGELDLTRGSSYEQLIDHPVRSIAVAPSSGLRRVVPSSKTGSLLWLNLAAAVLPDEWQAPLRPMPLGGLEPLTFAELELVRMWLEYGATRDGVVPGAAELVDACSDPPGRLEVEPLPPPPPDEGVQLRAPRQVLAPSSERETCFVSYYNLRGRAPAESVTPDGEHFRYKFVEARRDPLSHHAVVIIYEGEAELESPEWGAFACRGGAADGTPCDPRDTESCGEEGVCGSEPMPSLACIGFGPGDAAIGTGEDTLLNTMGASLTPTSGIYAEAPLEGILVWNSHAFNVSPEPAKLDMWLNLYFARASEQRHLVDRFVDLTQIGKMRAPAFGADQVCHHKIMDDGAHLLDMTSHTHKRGAKFEIFEGRFACNGGPLHGSPCTPFGPEPDFPVADLCAGFPCQSRRTPRAGDCDHDLSVDIAELVTSIEVANGRRPLADCPRSDGNGDGRVSIAELITAVDSALRPPLRDAAESLVYTSLTYADPSLLQFDPPRYLAPRGAAPEERTLTYCALYDNGFTNPDEVKRLSTSPDRSTCQPTHCAEGRVGEPCGEGDPSERDRSCDAGPGAGDGFCDACTVGFGVTTDDEMFVLSGSYYVQ